MPNFKCSRHPSAVLPDPMVTRGKIEKPSCPMCKNATFVNDQDTKMKGPTGLTVTVDPAVTAWASKKDEKMLKDLVPDAAKNGIGAGGLRNVGGQIFDLHSRDSSDYRIVCIANATTLNVAAVFRHGPNGGKEFICGDRNALLPS